MSRSSVVFRQKIFVKNKNNIRKQVTIKDWTISSKFVSFKLVVVVGSLITTTALAKFCCKKFANYSGVQNKSDLNLIFIHKNNTVKCKQSLISQIKWTWIKPTKFKRCWLIKSRVKYNRNLCNRNLIINKMLVIHKPRSFLLLFYASWVFWITIRM